ncbi:hypothetical protein KJ885_05545 [Patescibacteria group bacterium]|nr:hypothetical protein [Patescibacteria group bacterium]
MDVHEWPVYLRYSYLYQHSTLSALSIEIFFGLLQEGCKRLRKLDKKYGLVKTYLGFRDKYLR